MVVKEEVKQTTPAYDYNQRVNQINDLYDKNLNVQKTALESTYKQNLSDLEANRNKIAQQYQAQRNANAVSYERNRRNFNQQAMMNGLNVGAGSQAALAQNSAYQGSVAALGAAEAGANTELNKSIADLKIKYESDVNQAIAKNDYNRAATLLDEYNNAYSKAMTRAQQLAQYGDFSGYSDIYGADAARQMSSAWEIQNPVAAYTMGRIDANKYRQITGANPPEEAMAKNEAERRAALLAQYGDFSGMSDLYGSDAAGRMSSMWGIQNPVAAYNTGQITADQYRQITGQEPPEIALQQSQADKANAEALDRAKLLASFGDFSGFESLYGKDTANLISKVWNSQNPDVAYFLGRITAEQYTQLTGKAPAGATISSMTGGGSGNGTGGGPGGTPLANPDGTGSDGITLDEYNGNGTGATPQTYDFAQMEDNDRQSEKEFDEWYDTKKAMDAFKTDPKARGLTFNEYYSKYYNPNLRGYNPAGKDKKTKTTGQEKSASEKRSTIGNQIFNYLSNLDSGYTW